MGKALLVQITLNWMAIILLLMFTTVVGWSEPKKCRIALIVPEGDTSFFWQAVHAGAIKAQRELTNERNEVQLLWIAPHEPNSLKEEVNLVGDAVGSGVDGIAVAPLDPHALVPPIELAIRQKIPVVAVELPLDYPLITSIVATNNFQCGSEASIIAGKLIGERGTVLIVRHLLTDLSSVKRENGFLDGIREFYGTVEAIVPQDYAGATDQEAYQFTLKLLKTYGGRINAMFTADPMITKAAHRALKDVGLTDRVKHVGFLYGNDALTAIKSGELQGLVAPDPFTLGYLSTKCVYEAIKGHTVNPRIEVTEAAVIPGNLEDPQVKAILQPPIDQYLRGD